MLLPIELAFVTCAQIGSSLGRTTLRPNCRHYAASGMMQRAARSRRYARVRSLAPAYVMHSVTGTPRYKKLILRSSLGQGLTG